MPGWLPCARSSDPTIRTASSPFFFGEGFRGTFVDVGAADVQRNSLTYNLEQAGWSGILIEPRPDCVEQSRRERRSPVYQFAYSSPSRTGRTMTLHLANGISSLNDSFVVSGMRPKGGFKFQFDP